LPGGLIPANKQAQIRPRGLTIYTPDTNGGQAKKDILPTIKGVALFGLFSRGVKQPTFVGNKYFVFGLFKVGPQGPIRLVGWVVALY